MVAGSHAPDQRVVGMRASVGSHTTVALGPIVDLSCTVQTTVGRCDLEIYRGAFVILEIPEFHGVILVFPQGIDPVVRTLRHHVVCSEEFAQIDHKRECAVQAEEAFRAVTVASQYCIIHSARSLSWRMYRSITLLLFCAPVAAFSSRMFLNVS